MFKLVILIFLTVNTVWCDITTKKPTHGHAKPWEPESRPEKEGWSHMFDKHVEESKRDGDKIQVIFYGDSITAGWTGRGIHVWQKYYANVHAVNYGIGGDHTQHVLWRIENGEVEGIHPKLVILKIGTNNLGVDNDEDIAHGIKAIIEALHKKLPNTKILVLGILPRDKYENFDARIKNVNSLIAKYDNGHSVRFLDMGSHFVDASDHLILDLYNPDKLHLVDKGYEVWAQTMDPLFKQMMKENK